MDLAPIVRAAGGLSAVQRARYSRQILLNGFGEEAQLRLLASRVLVVGAGGLGSPALLYLAAAGVGAIGIVDDDAVALSNLHRQVIHDSSGVGAAKTACAAAHIRALNPDVTVVEHRERLTEANVRRIMEGYDVVLDGADNFPTRYVVDAACSDLSVPEVWGSVLRYAAQVCVFWTVAHGVITDMVLLYTTL
ncbi:MAG: HesA/MoeB/ThiF family protein, partial [Peptidiphaga sp.]